MLKQKWGWFFAFTAVFAALVAYVFWGTWSLDFVPVMPDDTTVHSMVYGDYVAKTLNKFWTMGKFVPSDILWDGLLFSPYFCQELKYAVALFCAGIGLAYFLRGRGLGPLASYGAGLLLSFCGYWASLYSAGHGGWFVWMTFGVFAFGLADRAVRKNKLKNWLLLGACVAWGSFYQPDLWFLFSLFTAAYFVWCCAREHKLPWKGALIALVAFLIVGAPGLLGGIKNKGDREQQIVNEMGTKPGETKVDDNSRWVFVTNWSLPSDEVAEFFVPRLNGDTSCPLTLSVGMRHGTGVKPYTGALGRPIDAKQGNYRQHCLYVGWITCLLALAGCVFGLTGLAHRAAGDPRSANRADALFFTGAAILCCLLSLGRYCEPLYRLIFVLPIGDSIRCPVKWHHLTEFALCVLAGYGIEGLVRKLPATVFRLPSVVLIAAVVLLGAFDVARIDKIFCAPVDLRQVRKTNSNMQMSVLRRQDFANPQVAEMVKRGQVVSLANYLGNPDMFLVEVLTPRKPSKPLKLPPMTAATWLGILSLCGTLGVLGYAAVLLLRRKRTELKAEHS